MNEQDHTPEHIIEAIQRALLARYEAESRACSTHERATRSADTESPAGQSGRTAQATISKHRSLLPPAPRGRRQTG